jgi:uncharacterized protein
MLAEVRSNLKQVRRLCRENSVLRLELFGSAARGDFDTRHSDLDFLVDFEDLGWEGSSDRYFNLLFGLEDLFGRRIDLVERSAVTNPYFLPHAARHREVLYDTRGSEAA